MTEFAPSLWVEEIEGGVRLSLDGVVSADGVTLQEAADELVWKLLVAAMALRTGGLGTFRATGRPNPGLVSFLWELGQIASVGGDIRERVFGPNNLAA